MDVPNVFRDFKIVTSKQSQSISISPGSKSSTTTSAPGNSLIPSKKENSMVRFDEKALARKAGVDHRYLPHIHRQKTEILPKSHILENLEELNMLLPEDISHRDSAEIEANKILNKFVPSLKAVSNLDFKTFYFVENEVQFHQEPRTLYCILPFKYDCAHVKHLDPGYVTFRLPKADSRNDSYKCLRSDEGTQLSPVKFHSHFEQLFTKTIDKLVKARRKVRFEEKLKQENEKKISGDEIKEVMITEGESELQKLIDSSMQDAVDEITIDDNVLNNSSPPDDQNLIQNAIDADDTNVNADLHIHLENKNGGDATDVENTSLENDNPEDVPLGEDRLFVPETGSRRRISQGQRISVAETCESVNLTIQHSEELKSPRLNWKKIVEKDKPLTFKLDFDWFLEIVPAIFKASKEPVYVTKAYTDDTNPRSDLRWRICFAKRETKILKSIGKTDKDLRLATIKLVTAILKCDSRLSLLDEYQIQTCLLHEMDDCVDENPRWQRQTLEPCVKSLINKVFTFISGKALPHFFIPDVNLLDNWTASLDVCITGACIDSGASNRSGTRLGPRQIRTESSLVREVNPATGAEPYDSLQVADVGDIPLCMYDVPEACQQIKNHVGNLMKDGCKVITLGGDHTISYPLLQAVKEKYGPVGLIHLDAHSDTSDTMFGNKLAHGTPFRRAVEDGCLDCSKVFQIGLRGSGYSLQDYDWAKQQGFNVIRAEECWYKPMAPLMEEIRRTMGDNPVYISFDIDAIDPAFCPGTGTPEIGGLTVIQCLEIIRGCRGLNIVGGDMVEVSPAYDISGNTALTAANFVFEMLCIFPGVRYSKR